MVHLLSFLAPRGAVAQETSALCQETVCLPLPWLLPVFHLCPVEVRRASLVAGEGSWLEAPRSRWWPCSAVSFVQIRSLAVRGSAVPKETHTRDAPDAWSRPRADQLWEAADCPTALVERSAPWMTADLSSQWYSVIIVESCGHLPGLQLLWKIQSPETSVTANCGTQAESALSESWTQDCVVGTPRSCSEECPCHLPSHRLGKARASQ